MECHCSPPRKALQWPVYRHESSTTASYISVYIASSSSAAVAAPAPAAVNTPLIDRSAAAHFSGVSEAAGGVSWWATTAASSLLATAVASPSAPDLTAASS